MRGVADMVVAVRIFRSVGRVGDVVEGASMVAEMKAGGGGLARSRCQPVRC